MLSGDTGLLVLECQATPITLEDWAARTRAYEEAGARVLWVWNANLLTDHHPPREYRVPAAALAAAATTADRLLIFHQTIVLEVWDLVVPRREPIYVRRAIKKTFAIEFDQPSVAELLQRLATGRTQSPGPGRAAVLVQVEDAGHLVPRDRLHLVSMSRRRVVEPQVFHALALDKQAPPLARFLAHLPRAFTTAWTVLDWGPYADGLPYLPGVRFRRIILAPARWRLPADDLPGDGTRQDALGRWRERWRCPTTVDLRDDDRTLRLTLDEPIHAAILHAHLMRRGHAILTDAAAEFGWFDNHAHEIVLPLVATGSAAPSPLAGSLPVVTNRGHGQLPGEADATWLYAKIHVHPERQNELITERLPALGAVLGTDAAYWFVRYRSPQETDHLRLRVRVPERGRYGVYAAAVGDWARQPRGEGVAGWLVLDSYQPEVGRYGDGAAMDAAELVFIADSRAVAEGLRHLPAGLIHPTALAAVSMVDIVSNLLGCDQAMDWLAARPTPVATAADTAVASQAVCLAPPGALRDLPCPEEVTRAWQARATALAAYRAQLPADASVETVVESLLHMHHNRAIGIDPDSERTCRHLARRAALAWRARRARTGR